MAHILLRILTALCFQAFRKAWTLTQTLIRWTTGFNAEMMRKSEAYETSAQVMDIRFRYRFDEVVLPNSSSHFITTHNAFVHPEYVLQKEITIYAIEEDAAYFVEAPKGVEVWRSCYGAFHRLAQFEHALRLVRLPLYAFHELADKTGDPPARLVIIMFPPRSGSTLLCQMFEATQKCVTLAEPSILRDPVLDPDRRRRLFSVLKSGVRLLCKKVPDMDCLAYVIKIAMVSTAINNVLRETHPDSKFFFLYRNAEGTTSSSQKILLHLPAVQVLPFLSRFTLSSKQSLYRQFFRRANFPTSVFEVYMQSQNPLLVTSFLFWVRYMTAYRGVSSTETDDPNYLEIPAVKYEDIIADPVKSMRIILGYCGLPSELAEAALSAMGNDSQANTFLSRDKMAKVKVTKPQGRDLEDLNLIAKAVELPAYSQDLRFPQTITKRS